MSGETLEERAEAIFNFTRARALEAGGPDFAEWWRTVGARRVPRCGPQEIVAVMRLAADAWRARTVPSAATVVTRDRAFNDRDPIGFFFTHCLQAMPGDDFQRLDRVMRSGDLTVSLVVDGVALDASTVLRSLMDDYDARVRREALALFDQEFGSNLDGLMSAAEDAAGRVREASDSFLREAARRLNVEMLED